MLVSIFPAKAQLTAAFTADTTRHCAPKRINFQDQSFGGGTIVYRRWDFANGGVSNSNDPQPSRLYTSSGVYTVRLTVSDGTDTATAIKTSYISIYADPSPDFSFSNLSQCVPKSVSFTDNTTIGDAPINSWEWDFGDLSAKSTASNPNHLYNGRGTYTVSLTVVDTNSCFASISKTNLIVVEFPTAQFTVNGSRSDCQAPLQVNFTNQSANGNGNLSYNWTFGDGNTATGTNPSHTYMSSGSYTIRLIATDTSGCTDTITRVNYVTIGQTQANFIFQDTMCLNQVDTLHNTSTGANTFSWDYGNGQTATSRDGVALYTSSGTYTVHLIASAGPTCIDTTTKTIYVQEVSAMFGIDSVYSCQSPFTVNLSDSSSSNVKSWQYLFSDSYLFASVNKSQPYNGTIAASSIQQNPSMTIQLPTMATGAKPRVKRGEFDFQLIVTTNAGCKDTIRKNKLVEIWEPDVYISGDTLIGCAPLTPILEDSTISKENVVKWEWDFGRSLNDTASGAGPKSVSYTQYGTYMVNLKITNSLGCVAYDSVPIAAGAQPIAAATIIQDTLCQFGIMGVENLTIDSIGFDYSFGWSDGWRSGLQNDSGFYQALSDTGWVSLTFTVSHLGCLDTLIVPRSFYVGGPIVKMSPTVDCSDPSTAVMSAPVFMDVQRWRWDFGDGQKDSLQQNPRHAYSAPGSYNVSITAYNDTTGCVSRIDQIVYITALKAVIHVEDSLFCPVNSIEVRGDSSKGVFGNRYSWGFGNGFKDFFKDVVPAGAKTTYSSPGMYTIRLITTDVNGCEDTSYKTIEVYDLVPQVSTSPAVICEADSIRLEDITNSKYGIVQRRWSYNSIQLDSGRVYNDSLFFVDSLIGVKSQIQVQQLGFDLFIQDSLGCNRSLFVPIEVRKLLLGTILTDSAMCENQSFGGIDTIANVFNTHVWDFGDGTRDSNFQFSNKVYLNAGDYPVTLIVTDTAGCVASDTIPVSMEHIKDLGFTVDRRDSTCYPFEIYFSDTSNTWNAANRAWLWGDGSQKVNTPVQDSIRKSYAFPGVFNVRLVITTEAGCKDSVQYDNHIKVSGPYASYTVLPDSACIGDSINFILDSIQNVGSLDWDFGDGFFQTEGSLGDTIKHAYTFTGNFNAIMLFSDTLGTCNQFDDREIVINKVESQIVIDPDTFGCVPLNLVFRDSLKQATEWVWVFGEEGTGTDSVRPFSFQIPDTHQIVLAVFNEETGCRDTSRAEVIVFPLPNPSFQLDSLLCLGDTVLASGRGGLSFNWEPKENFEFPDSAKSNFSADSTLTVSLMVTDSNTCSETVVKEIQVVQIPSLANSKDTNIIIGEELILFMESDQDVSILWTPEDLFHCPTCPNPQLRPLKDTTVCVSITDEYGCFTIDSCLKILVEGKFSLDLPQTFTPNGDGANDRLFIQGWGIQDLLEWKIFNRWGEIVFETSDISEGWDGSHQGSAQNMETFSYTVRILNYAGEEMQKAGFVTLVR